MQLPQLRRDTRPRPVLSYRARALYVASWAAGRTVLQVPHVTPRSIALSRRIDTLAAKAPKPRKTTVTPHSFGPFGGEWVRSYRATGAPSDGVVLYFHGGGFFCCGLNTHRFGVAAVSARSRLPVLSVDYRQLPEVPIPDSVADCLTAYRYLLDEGIAADRIVFAGDSAGGYLTFATALLARDSGLPMPAGIVAQSPLLDIDSSARMRHANSKRDTYIPVNRMAELSAFWTDGVFPVHRDRAPRKPPISPVNADLTGMPPSLIMAAETEVLLSDAEVMAERLWAAGAQCKLQVWRGQVHAFPVLGTFTPETRKAGEQIGRFIRDTLKLG